MTKPFTTVYLTGWEFNRIAKGDPLTPVVSGLPAQCLWSGAAQFFLFEHVYCTKESLDGDYAAAVDLGWTTGDIFQDLATEKILKPVDWTKLAEQTPGLDRHLKRNADRLRANLQTEEESATQAIERLVSEGSYDKLEGIKQALMEPIFSALRCYNNISPSSVRVWFPSESTVLNDPIVRAIVEPLRTSRFRIKAGLELCNPPGTGLSEAVVAAQKREEKNTQAPLIPGLLSGRIPQSEYHKALEPNRATYEPINSQLMAEYRKNLSHLLRLRELASKHLWNDLHNDWLPAYHADPSFLPKFEQLLNRALRHPKLDSLLNRTSELAFGKEMPIAAGVLTGATASAFGASPEASLAAAGVASLVATATSGLAKDMHEAQRSAHKGLQTFYQAAAQLKVA